MTGSASVAIVGIGGIFPDAPDLDVFWDNIRKGRCAAREVPPGRWLLPADSVFHPEPGKADCVYSRRGCFIDSLPPLQELSSLAVDGELLSRLDPLFHLLLAAGKRAMDDAVCDPLERSRVGVIIGNLALPTEHSAQYSRQWLGPLFEEKLLGSASQWPKTDPLNRYVAGLPAGLLASALRIGGGSCTLDAACASSLYAVKLAADELLSGRADAMLAGGVSRPDPLYTQMGFSQLRALSRRGVCSPFDAAGDGLVVGEGAGIFLLKRTEDAVAHGDRIYGVIRAAGLSNDVGGSLLAPLSEGQLRAMRAAYRDAGWEPRDVDLVECHATGTPVGDAVEFSSLCELWQGGIPRRDRCTIGSVKSNIGHLLTAAGAAALTKVLLALKHGTLPPTANFTSPPSTIPLEGSPFRILSEPAVWRRPENGAPRRAAVSAFGFGGINAHLLVEEWLPAPAKVRSLAARRPPRSSGVAVVGLDARFGPWQSLEAFQERVLAVDDPAQPSAPQKWWGAEASPWFAAQRSLRDGYYIGAAEVAADAFRIPPREMEEMLPQQLLMLQTAAGAMADAGLGREGNGTTGVFIGIALDMNTTNFSFRWSVEQQAAQWAGRLGRTLAPGELAEWTRSLREAAGPPLTANRVMGALGNIVASRIAREFQAGGPSFTLSSEETSGLQALETAVRLLQKGEIDRALVGSVDFAGDLRGVAGRDDAYASAGGKDCGVPGEGAAAVVLKRLEDARRDGDRIYAIVRGVGHSGGETPAPAEGVYRRALQRAWDEAALDPSTVGLLEGHGGAAASAEASALARFFGTARGRSCALTAVSGDIGDSGAASGLASFVRACLAIHREIIPGTRGTDLAPLEGTAPFHIPRAPRYWLRNRSESPRRAGVSAAGVDGTCLHVVLEGEEKKEAAHLLPLGIREALFILCAADTEMLQRKLEALGLEAEREDDLQSLARAWRARGELEEAREESVALVARTAAELTALCTAASAIVAGKADPAPLSPALRERIFYTPEPVGGKVAFVFPGSGNHFPGMGAELSARWPGVFHRLDRDNARLASQFRPELFWNGAPPREIDDDHKGVIFGQVSVGCAVSEAVSAFGVRPDAVIGYSLGETAGLFATGAWRDRDMMLQRMERSELFTRQLAGECRAAARAWKLSGEQKVEWSIGVAEAGAEAVRRALQVIPRVYLLIVNTPDECVVGGEAEGVRRLVSQLGCRFFPLQGVTTVHCEVALEVEREYRDLHLFHTAAPREVTFYSCASGRPYLPTRESAADSILAQAVKGIDFPALVNRAWEDGVRIFLEMGPGSSCSRMIGRILQGRSHVARSACQQGQDGEGGILRMLAQLAAEKVPLDLKALYTDPAARGGARGASAVLRVACSGASFTPPPPPVPAPVPVREDPAAAPSPAAAAVASTAALASAVEPPLDPLLLEFAAAQQATLAAHEAYLRFAAEMTAAVADAAALEMRLQEGGAATVPTMVARAVSPAAPRPVFDREMCLEFARGSVGRMLGPQFAGADSFPTRVRLPDEPLMLVDRITLLEGEPLSMTSGRVVTEHDILPGAWYLDGGKIPTCIAVEAGQADLFLSGYLGIDFVTRGLAVYRLLDAVVTFHRDLPSPGDTICYDIRIDRFFRQGETRLFRFRFEATVNGEPLLSMRDGCAGFFTGEELEAGKGIVHSALELKARSAGSAVDRSELVPVGRESYDAAQLDALRRGDLAGCFGPLFAGLPIRRPLTIPAGRMNLVHRVLELDPDGGLYGLGIIRAEADIRPDDWFLTCHFVDDRVMPGTLMYECCLHTLRIFLLRMGWVAQEGEAAWQPVPGISGQLRCRGQVLETTRTAGYEVTIRELGYRPEPYAEVDALMYADGRPIVEITGMSVRLSGTGRERLAALWQKRPQAGHRAEEGLPRTAVYSKEQILAYSNGNPSEGFGERYRIFDGERRIARLPGPPYQFMDRVVRVQGEPWVMAAGAEAEAEYDIPADAWYFAAERSPRMPFAVLLEAALQPCGWLAAYVGSALTSPSDLSFRNLGGSAVQLRPVTPESGTLTMISKLTKVASSGGMIIQEFDFSVADRQGLLYQGETMFGFFSAEALANQVGIREATPYLPSPGEEERGNSLPYPEASPYPEKMLRMLDRIELFVPDGGPSGLGFLRGVKEVDPGEWFFAAHFYQDPVTPGSLGLESFLQLLKYAAVQRWGWSEGSVLASVVPGRRHRWLYRGQIVPENRRVIVELAVTAVDDAEKVMTADGFLSVDGRVIYQMNDFTVGLEQAPAMHENERCA